MEEVIVINGQVAKTPTDYVTRTLYKLADIPQMFRDYEEIEYDVECGRLSRRSGGALKANITRRISHEVWQLIVWKVPVWTFIPLREANRTLFEEPHGLVLKKMGATRKDPKPAVIEARLAGRQDPANLPKKRSARSKTGPKTVFTHNAVPLLPAPKSPAAAPTKSVSDRQRAAAFKAWETRRARAGATAH